MSKLDLENLGTKKYLAIGAVVVLAVALVVGALLIRRAGVDAGPAESVTQTTVATGATAVTVTTLATRPSIVAPQTEAVPLGQIASPPQQTLAFINADDYSADSEYQIKFVPYGTSARPNSLVIQIAESTPNGDIDKPFDFNGRNVLVDTSILPAEMSVGLGGTYSGVLMLVKQDSGLAEGGVLAPMLIEASAAR